MDSGKSDIVKTDNLRTYALCGELPRVAILRIASTGYLSTHFQCDPVMHAIVITFSIILPMLICYAYFRPVVELKQTGFLQTFFPNIMCPVCELMYGKLGRHCFDQFRIVGYFVGLFDTIGIEYRVSEKYWDFSGIGIDPSIGV